MVMVIVTTYEGKELRRSFGKQDKDFVLDMEVDWHPRSEGQVIWAAQFWTELGGGAHLILIMEGQRGEEDNS